MAQTPEPLLGDLRERPDGGFDGWCWAPARPQERLVVDLLVGDSPAVSMVAAMFRRDLLARGCGDGHHGFSLRLPANLVPADAECLISARERQSGRVFGRVLRTGPGRRPPQVPQLAATADAVAALEQEVASRHAVRTASPAVRMRTALGQLSAILAARTADAHPRPVLPQVEAPVFTVVLRAGIAADALRCIAALSPALEYARAELLVADSAGDPGQALRVAAQTARGHVLVLLDATSATPSAAALLALARAVAAAPATLLLSESVATTAASLAPLPTAETLLLPARLGVLIGGERALWQEIGAAPLTPDAPPLLACVDLALRGRLLGRPWLLVREPPAVALPTTEPASPLPLEAATWLHARWGFGT
jgi:hypothetical protein